MDGFCRRRCAGRHRSGAMGSVRRARRSHCGSGGSRDEPQGRDFRRSRPRHEQTPRPVRGIGAARGAAVGGARRPRRQCRRRDAVVRARCARRRPRRGTRARRSLRRRTTATVAGTRGNPAPGRRLRKHPAAAGIAGTQRRDAGQRGLNPTEERPMKPLTPALTALSLAIAMSMALPVSAQEWTPAAPTAAGQKALDEARRKLDEAAKAYAELAAKHGPQSLLRKPVIGVVLAPDTTSGVRIVAVTPGGAAADAGLKSGDRLVAIDGNTISGATPDARVERARAAIARHDEKSKVQLRYIRDGKEKTVVVTPKAGDRLMFIGDDGRHEGVLARQHREAAREAA